MLPESRVVTAGNDRTVQVWETRDPPTCLASITAEASVSAICGLESSRVVAGLGTTLRCWDVSDPAKWKLTKVVDVSATGVTKLCALPPGRLITGDSDGQVKIWNTATWEVERELEGHTGRIACLVTSGDGRLLGVGDSGATLRLWRVKDALRVQSEGPLELTHFEVQLPSGSTINVMVPEGGIVDAVKEAVRAVPYHTHPLHPYLIQRLP